MGAPSVRFSISTMGHGRRIESPEPNDVSFVSREAQHWLQVRGLPCFSVPTFGLLGDGQFDNMRLFVFSSVLPTTVYTGDQDGTVISFADPFIVGQFLGHWFNLQ